MIYLSIVSGSCGNLHIVAPILVEVFYNGGDYVASTVEANINASGSTVGEALANLTEMVWDTYFLLRDMEGVLSPHMAKQLAYLRDHIQ